jgi:hypothetical protein
VIRPIATQDVARCGRCGALTYTVTLANQRIAIEPTGVEHANVCRANRSSHAVPTPAYSRRVAP